MYFYPLTLLHPKIDRGGHSHFTTLSYHSLMLNEIYLYKTQTHAARNQFLDGGKIRKNVGKIIFNPKFIIAPYSSDLFTFQNPKIAEFCRY